MPDQKLDRLTSQLGYLPFLVGRMGISIAEAQQALNADYLRTLSQLLVLIKASTDGGAVDQETLKKVLSSLAPSRYQFTETTIDFSADLSERMEAAGGGGLGLGLGAFAINASFAIGFAYDYRASARVTAVLHAIPPDTDFGDKLLSQAAQLKTENVKLPDKTDTSQMVWEQVDTLRQILGGKELPEQPEG